MAVAVADAVPEGWMTGIDHRGPGRHVAAISHASAHRARPSSQVRRTPMVLNELVPFLGMCTLAAATYSLACWLGCWF
jgi:hypothetical protein